MTRRTAPSALIAPRRAAPKTHAARGRSRTTMIVGSGPAALAWTSPRLTGDTELLAPSDGLDRRTNAGAGPDAGRDVGPDPADA